MSCREMGQVRELFSLNIVGKQLTHFGFSAILRTPKIGPLVRAPESDLQTCELGAEKLKPEAPPAA